MDEEDIVAEVVEKKVLSVNCPSCHLALMVYSHFTEPGLGPGPNGLCDTL